MGQEAIDDALVQVGQIQRLTAAVVLRDEQLWVMEENSVGRRPRRGIFDEHGRDVLLPRAVRHEPEPEKERDRKVHAARVLRRHVERAGKIS